MALFSNLVSFLLFTLLLLSLQIHGRDSQFFSKVSHPINNNNGKETDDLIPNKKEEPVMNKPDHQQEPVFIPETDNNNYGLYGHESAITGQFPPAATSTTTATYQPYKTEESEEYNKGKQPNKYSYYNRDSYNTNQKNDFINNNYYKDAYGNDLDNTRYTERRYEDMPDNQMRKKNQKFYNRNNGGYDRYDFNGERQGMSDTRFMEGGKYFYENNNSMEGYQNLGFEGRVDDFQP